MYLLGSKEQKRRHVTEWGQFTPFTFGKSHLDYVVLKSFLRSTPRNCGFAPSQWLFFFNFCLYHLFGLFYNSRFCQSHIYVMIHIVQISLSVPPISSPLSKYENSSTTFVFYQQIYEMRKYINHQFKKTGFWIVPLEEIRLLPLPPLNKNLGSALLTSMSLEFEGSSYTVQNWKLESAKALNRFFERVSWFFCLGDMEDVFWQYAYRSGGSLFALRVQVPFPLEENLVL